MTAPLLGAFTGLLLGLGLFQLYLVRRSAQPTLGTRIAPMFDARERDRVRSGQSPIRVLIATAARDLGRVISLAGSSSSSVTARLATLGQGRSLASFRTEQLAWSAVGLVIALPMVPALLRWNVPTLVMIALMALSALAGALVRDTVLTWQVQRYRAKLLAQLPDVAELIGLSLSAGEGPIAALTRVSDLGNSELAVRLRQMLGTVHSGQNLSVGLAELGRDSGIAQLERFSDSFVTALDRGTPLAGVLSALAADLRAEQREALMESGGKREIGMLVPVVFLIMPISILFALFPVAASLRIVMP
ncbi:tight adherence protein C [Bowdeniella nasicola]|uniref:Tight adherence protein C n=1 Tax=Bowdeniella nasicola TaxID=208480 RepID=A0A1H3Z2L5_9ACTO|nr:type II secretion system F family protein [Bowdeniella nasicola]SEA18093.1 tight adherence protein C [Bowdeniella nasicola]